MGLDMFALTTDAALESAVDFDTPDAVEIHAWRGHANLHAWMEVLYYAKGGVRLEFNVANVELSLRDISDLAAAIITHSLPESGGFLLGESDLSEVLDDLAFVDEARQAVMVGKTVFYRASW